MDAERRGSARAFSNRVPSGTSFSIAALADRFLIAAGRFSALRKLPYAIVAASLTFFGFVTLLWISRPGLQYDETLFVNAALGGRHDYRAFIYDRLLGVPTMLMPYIGALKA